MTIYYVHRMPVVYTAGGLLIFSLLLLVDLHVCLLTVVFLMIDILSFRLIKLIKKNG